MASDDQRCASNPQHASRTPFEEVEVDRGEAKEIQIIIFIIYLVDIFIGESS